MATITTAAITSAVEALTKWQRKTQQDSSTSQLFQDSSDTFIYLILTLTKIPQKRTNPTKIPLPYPLYQNPEACLIIDDRPSSNLTSRLAKDKLLNDGIMNVKVIKLSKLKTSYKPFEAKRKLCDSYEIFFADKRVVPLLPKLLGKTFFKKRKLPLGVDLEHKNWKEQMERWFKSGLLFFGNGSCSVVRVAKSGMGVGEIVENVERAVEGVVGCVPKKWSGVRSLHLKVSGSVSLPLYQCLPDVKLRIEGVGEKGSEGVVDLMEVENVGGKAKKKKSKKIRIHDVDHNENDASDSGELDAVKVMTESVESDGSGKKKKRKGNVVDRKKSKKGKVDVVNTDENDDEVEEIENVELVSDVEAVNVKSKSGKKSVKDKKRKGNVVVEENDAKSSDKKAKKKGEKKVSVDLGKKEKKKGRSVSRA